MMAEDSMPMIELARNCEQKKQDFLKEGLKFICQALMEEEVQNQNGASLHERSEDRITYRNGYREREWDTRAGTIPLKIPKLRNGTYFPSFLEPRRRVEKALYAVVQEAYVKGVSTRKVDDLVQALGIDRMDKSTVSRICKELDAEVTAFRERPLEAEYVYLWLDATYIKVRELGRVVSKAVVVAIAVTTDGEREIVGFDLGPTENEEFWREFLRGLVRRGLGGVHLVTSDAHVGLKKAIETVCDGAAWQRCRVHFMRNVLSKVSKVYQGMVSASVRTIFLQPDRETAQAQLREVSDKMSGKFEKVAKLLEMAEADVLSFFAFPVEHRCKIWSTNPIERIMKEVKRRTRVVGLFPNEDAAVRLVGAVLLEQHEQWAVSGKRYVTQRSMKELLEGTSPEEMNNSFLPNQAGFGR